MSLAIDREVPHHVYICYDADDWILYIGRTKDVSHRIWLHTRRNYWWIHELRAVQAIGPMPYEDACDLEGSLIYRLAPLGNVQGNAEVTNFFDDEGWNCGASLAHALGLPA
jgi:hypothetical protein